MKQKLPLVKFTRYEFDWLQQVAHHSLLRTKEKIKYYGAGRQEYFSDALVEKFMTFLKTYKGHVGGLVIDYTGKEQYVWLDGDLDKSEDDIDDENYEMGWS